MPEPGSIEDTSIYLDPMVQARRLVIKLNLGRYSDAWAWVFDSKNTFKMFQVLSFVEANGDSNEAKASAKEVVKANAAEKALSSFPLVKYPEDKTAQYRRDYPKLTEYLKNELPKIANDEKIINSIHGITDAPKEIIREALKWGKGPEIEIKQLGGEGDNELYGSYRGHVDATKINTLFLDVDLANDLENLENSQDFRDAIAFLIAVTLLHEYNHLGDFVFGDHFWGELHMENRDDENEAGIIFEKEVFGESVWRSNAGLILRNYKLH